MEEELLLSRYEAISLIAEVAAVLWILYYVCSCFYRKKFDYNHYDRYTDKFSVTWRIIICAFIYLEFHALFKGFTENLLYSIALLILLVLLAVAFCFQFFYRYKLTNDKGSEEILKNYKIVKLVIAVLVLLITALAYLCRNLPSAVFL